MKDEACPHRHKVIEGEEFARTQVRNLPHVGNIEVAIWRWWGHCKACGKPLEGESVRPPDRD